MAYEPKYRDYTLSPYTGMTRKSWIDAAKYLLTGMFSHIKSENDPVILPRTEKEITYPHKDATGNKLKLEQMAQRFEGLARSLFIAAPVIHDDPETEICGIKLRDYYSRLILRSCTKGDSAYVGCYEDLQELAHCTHDPFKTFQQTVETCALVICLDVCREEIWNRYTNAEKDIIAHMLSSYAHKGTVPQNWRLFNMLDTAFLYREGYEIDKNVMLEHAQAILGYYAGGGWYRDGHSFDYYSCWAFNVYAPIWNRWYGYENEPYIASEFEKNSNELMKTYPDFFDADGFTNMWGRSNIYRCAAVSPLCENLTLNSPSMDAGLARRIASGSLLQFLQREDFLINGVPAMGFYGQFAPLVQGYSCAESVYWLGKAFLCLALPEKHLFWTEKENNGTWDKIGDAVKETVLDGPALCFTNHGANGTTVLRTGKIVKAAGDDHGMWNYSKLCYNTKYPWESAPCDNVESMQYVLKNEGDEKVQKCNITLWHGIRDGVLYRRQFFDWNVSDAMHWRQAVTLADMPVKYGILRADKLRLFKTPVSLTLGSYGFPDNGTEVLRKETGNGKAVVFKGYDAMGREKQLAMTIYDGWDRLEIVKSSGTNPDSANSIIAYAMTERKKQYGYESFILISQVITKETHSDFTDDELFPISDIQYTDAERCGGYGDVIITLKDGVKMNISFGGIEGNLQM